MDSLKYNDDYVNNAGDPGSIPESGRSPGEGNGNTLQYSCLENPTDREAWQATVHGVAKSRTQLSNFTFMSTTDDTTLMAESEELKSLSVRVREESEKVGLKLNIQKTKIVASSTITSCQIEGENVEAVTNFPFLGSTITGDLD